MLGIGLRTWAVLGSLMILADPRLKKLRNPCHLPAFPGVMEPCSSIPGRMRISSPALQDESLAQSMRTQLLKTSAITSITLNLRLGTALIHYQPEEVDAPVVYGAVIKLLGLGQKLRSEPLSKAEQGLHALAASISQGIMRSTNGLFNLRSLLGTGLTLTALLRLRACGWGMPGALTLLWWSTRLWGRDDLG